MSDFPTISGLIIRASTGWPALGETYFATPAPEHGPAAAANWPSEVVVQLLPEAESKHPSYRDKFLGSGLIENSLTHPNLVTILHLGVNESDGRLFLIYDIPHEAQSLAARVAKVEFLSPEFTRWLALELAGALDRLHREGRVHGDVSPHNVLIWRHRALLTDFYLSQVEWPGARGTPLGWPYMAPEQAGSEPHADDRTDVYRLAATCYFALTGARPFEGATFDEMCFAVLSRPLTWPATPRVPAAYRRIIERGMAKEPEFRQPNVVGFRRVLEVLSPAGSAASGPHAHAHVKLERETERRIGATRAEAERPPGTGRWRLWVPWLVFVALAAALWLVLQLMCANPPI